MYKQGTECSSSINLQVHHTCTEQNSVEQILKIKDPNHQPDSPGLDTKFGGNDVKEGKNGRKEMGTLRD